MAEFEVVEDDTPLGKFVYDGFAEKFQPRVEEIAEEFDLAYAGVIRSARTHTRVVCTAGPLAETYVRGAKGTKSVNEGCHEAYCERVHDTGEEVHIPDAEADEEWVGAEEFDSFGLRSYYGVPVRYDDTVVASVIAIHDEEYDFEAGDPSVVDTLRDLRDDIEADIESHFE
jgi:GAF domain-containing protein